MYLTTYYYSKGLFAERDYNKGEFVADYGGRILSLDDTERKDPSYFKVIGIDKRNGVIDGKYSFGDTLGRYIIMRKGNHPNCSWGKFDQKKQTIPIKTNKEVKQGEEFTVNYSPHIRRVLHSKKRGRPPKEQ
jgi:SET domain-containing protein